MTRDEVRNRVEATPRQTVHGNSSSMSMWSAAGNRAVSRIIQAMHETKEREAEREKNFQALLTAISKRDQEKFDELLVDFSPKDVHRGNVLYPLETAVKMGILAMVRPLFERYIAQGFRDDMLKGEKQEIIGRPIYWLGAICAAVAPLEDFIAVIDYLEKQLGIDDDQRKIDYLRRYQSAHPEKVEEIITHYYLDVTPGINDPGPNIDPKQDRSKSSVYDSFKKK